MALALVFNNESRSQVEEFVCATDSTIIDDVGELVATTYTLKILLVEFSNVKHNTEPYYTYTDFENLFFSENVYVSPNMYSPDGEPVYGSMRDYFSIMSDGDFNLNGYVVNQDEKGDGTPDWLELPLRKGQYDSTCFACWDLFLNHTLAAAINAGLDISTGPTTKLAIIYAGHTYRGLPSGGDLGSGLNPQAGTFLYNETPYHLYIHGEKFACCSPGRAERPDARFAEIGINAHEFAHLLGIPDLYDNGGWDMMNGGPTLGPNFRGACPAPLNPETRKKKGWLAFQDITENHTFQADYNLRDPEVFQIRSSTNSGYYWLIETRRFDANMTIGNTSTTDYNYYLLRSYFGNAPDQGVLVWRVPFSSSWGSILHANGRPWDGHPGIRPGDPFPGVDNVRVLSPWSDSRTSPIWVPNTKPSTNVGMEIAGEGAGYFTLDLYYSNPHNASPSKPQNIAISLYQDQLGYRYPRINWTAMQEPDVISGGNMLIHRRYKSSQIYPPQWGSWSLFATLSGTSTEYIDLSLPTAGSGSDSVQYPIQAKDSTAKLSVFSDVVSMEVSTDMWKPNVSSQKQITTFSLYQNYPNPFNPTTSVKYQLAASGFVQLRVFDILGRHVTTLISAHQDLGEYSATLNADELASGVYLLRLTVSDDIGHIMYEASSKLLLTR